MAIYLLQCNLFVTTITVSVEYINLLELLKTVKFICYDYYSISVIYVTITSVSGIYLLHQLQSPCNLCYCGIN